MSEQQTGSTETYGLDGALDVVYDRREATRAHHHGDATSNDHLASIYDDQADQFDAVVPFIETGLERGEQCIYVADDNSVAAVVAALREGGVDVDRARDEGALSLQTKDETYHRSGEFEQEAMLDFWREHLTEARDEDGYAGVRAAAEMTWAVDDPNTELAELVEYEAMLNSIYEGDDYVVLCQYNRDRFPAAVISDVIQSHPLVVYDGTVCQNFYYRPPDEFFGTDHPELDVDRTVEGLVSRARSKQALEEREQQLRERLRQQDVVAELGQRALEERDLDALFADVTEMVTETLDADVSEVLELTPGGDQLLLREGVGWPDDVVGETTVSTDRESPAGYTLRTERPVVVDDLATDPRFDGTDRLADHGLTSGVSVAVGSVHDPWGVLGVHTRDERSISEHDAAFVQSVANTVATAIDRTERERQQRDLYEITSSADRSFEEKLRALFDLGCDVLDMELGGMARIDPKSDLFEIEYVSGDHEHLQPGSTVDFSETYCRVHDDTGESVAITDPEAAGVGDTTACEEFGVKSYVGTRIAVEDGFDRTFFFVSADQRRGEFTEPERTFHQLMAEWVHHELDRREYERKLVESNERLEQFAYAASHDLQEPLRMVSSYLQLIDTRYAEALDEDAQEFIDYAVDGADRMREMIEGLLEYSRVETEGDSFEPVDLETVLDDILEDLRIRIDETDAEITVESLPVVDGDPNQLRQVFQNLLDNAIEYSGDTPPRVRVTARRTGDEYVVSVSDDGIGIDPDQTDRIFEVFQRLHTYEEHSGTGIGLAICQRIVERHGGEIWAEAEPGEGATFSFTLPTADDG